MMSWISDRDNFPKGTLVEAYDEAQRCSLPSKGIGFVVNVTHIKTHPHEHDVTKVGEYNYGIKVLWTKNGHSVIETELPWRVRRISRQWQFIEHE